MTVSKKHPRTPSSDTKAPRRSITPLHDTPTKLVEAALSLFARHGIEAVSIRQITLAAGQSNESAVHYHFRNKAGLIAAVLDYVNAQLAPMQREALDQLNAMAQQRAPTVREIVTLGVMPFVRFHAQSSTGRKSIRFLSRLTWQSNEGGLTLLIESLWPYYQNIESHLARALPHKPLVTLRLHGVLAISNVIHSLADTRLLGEELDLGIASDLVKDPLQLLSHFIDYIIGGLCSDERTGLTNTPPSSP